MPYPLFPVNKTDGTLYEGIQRYAGNGIIRYCPLCGKHRATGGGHMKHVLGLRQWVCHQHPRTTK